MIKNSILVAALAVLLSLLMHGTGLIVLFDPEAQASTDAAPEPTDSAAFEDFAEEALQPEAPEPTPEVEPEELIEPEPITQAQVASDNPQDVQAPDTGTETENLGRIEAEEVVASEPPAQGTEVEIPLGTPETPRQPSEVQTDETQEVVEATEPDVTEEPVEVVDAQPPEITIDSLEEDGDVQAVEAEEALASAVTRSLRPPPSRPTDDTFGAENGSEEVTEQPGLASELSLTQRTGIDLLAEAGSSALYGRESLNQARATGNAADTNYAGKVLMRLNRALRVYKNEKGSAVIRFQILPDGTVGWVRVIRSRGTPGIKVAAAANVRSAAPFPRPPDGKPVELGFTFQSR